MNEETVKIPSGTVGFEMPSGQVYQLPALSLARELEELSRTRQQEGVLHFQFLDEVRNLFRDRFGMELTYEQADWLKDEIGVAAAKKKRQQLESINERLTSAYSMDSIASTSPTNS